MSDSLRSMVSEVVQTTPIIDIHTHLYTSNFGSLSLWGIDEVVTYHYLIAELFRNNRNITPTQYWAMTKQQQADIIWDSIFVRNTPISEAARGVVSVMSQLGLDPNVPNLNEARKFFAAQKAEDHIKNVMKLANVTDLVMTNDPFNQQEREVWLREQPNNPHIHAALRMDPLLNDPNNSVAKSGVKEARKFVDEWIQRMKPLYMAVSMPYDFVYPQDNLQSQVLREVVIPAGRDHNLPFALMIGVARQVNPALKDAGDSVGKADIRTVDRICSEFPDNRFLVTMLSRENQHELCVTARKFANLMVFGCWWFLNNPSIITEMTNERIEMLGSTIIPQHSDARILEQILYKWAHSRRVIADVLYNNYKELAADGWNVTREQVQRDATKLFSQNFRDWVGLQEAAKA